MLWCVTHQFVVGARVWDLESSFGSVNFGSLLLSPQLVVSRTAQKIGRGTARTFMVIEKMTETGGKIENG